MPVLVQFGYEAGRAGDLLYPIESAIYSRCRERERYRRDVQCVAQRCLVMMGVGGVRNEAASAHDVVRDFPMRLRWACALEPHLRTRWATSFAPPVLAFFTPGDCVGCSLTAPEAASEHSRLGIGEADPGTHLLEIRLGKSRLIRSPLGGYGEESGRTLVIEQLRREKRWPSADKGRLWNELDDFAA